MNKATGQAVSCGRIGSGRNLETLLLNVRGENIRALCHVLFRKAWNICRSNEIWLFDCLVIS